MTGGRDWNCDAQRDTFSVWLHKVDRTLRDLDLTWEDIDYSWADTFESGTTPKDAAQLAMESLLYGYYGRLPS